jgi:hypothetical protein
MALTLHQKRRQSCLLLLSLQDDELQEVIWDSSFAQFLEVELRLLHELLCHSLVAEGHCKWIQLELIGSQ